MKNLKSALLVCSMMGFGYIRAQSYEVQVLALNIAKYTTMVKTVKEVKETYKILTEWYGKIEGVADGDLKLHNVFLDELKAVNPAVANYYKVADIMKKQKIIIDHYGRFFKFINDSENFNEREIDYLKTIFDNLLDESGNYLEQLIMAITASEMNMTDDERIAIIDTLNDNLDKQLSFLVGLNDRITVISAYKDKEKSEIREFTEYNLIQKN